MTEVPGVDAPAPREPAHAEAPIDVHAEAHVPVLHGDVVSAGIGFDTDEIAPVSPHAPTEDPAGAMTAPGRRARRPSGDSDGDGDDSRPSGRRRLLGWVAVLVTAALVAILLRLFVVQTFYVPSGSMLPTLQVGDRILVQKLGYSVTRGAIVVFRQPPRDYADPNGEDLVKRVIGLPGETISSVGDTVYIDGKPLSEPWLPKHDPLGPVGIQRTYIPPGYYYLLGDNRAHSYDSREWGVLPASYIVGRVFLVIWSHGHPAFHVF